MKYALALIVIVVYWLHHDLWNWTDTMLVFGFLPKGLAYHAGFSCLAAVMMAVLVKCAWPEHLENVEEHESTKGKPRESAH